MRPPPVRSGFAPRRDLVEVLTTTDADVIALLAPTGYGKTTVLAQWARAETSAVAWLNLGRADNNVKSLLSRLAASMRRVAMMSPGDEALFRFMGESKAVTDGASHLARLIEDIHPRPVVIVDNVEVIRSRAATDVIAELVRQLEGRVRIAMASHSTPRVGLPTVRASGRLLEITDEQLAFSVEEVEELVSRHGMDVSTVADIMQSTEGWPAAVFLYIIAARERKLDVGDIRLQGRHHLHDFVRSEIVPHLSKRRRQFLSLMSPLERMSGPLCDEVSASTGSQRLLQSLESETHLIHHLDQDDTWFVMNRVLRAALRAELEHTDPEAVSAVHEHAAEWFEANGMLSSAIAHASIAKDMESVARLMSKMVKPHYTGGERNQVLEWMTWLEQETDLAQYPELAAVGALVHIQEGDTLATDRWMEAALSVPTAEDVHPLVWMVRALGTRSGIDDMIADAAKARAGLEPGSAWMPAALLTSALAHMWTEDFDGAEPFLSEAATLGERNGSWSTTTLALAERALIAIRRNQWDLACDLASRSVQIIDEHGLDGYPTSGLGLVVSARCAGRRGDITKSRALLARSASVRLSLSSALPGLTVQTLLEMARTHIEQSDIAGARTLVREAEDVLVQRPGLGLLPHAVDTLNETISRTVAGPFAPQSLTKAELRLLPLLATHLSFLEIGEQLFISRHTVKSQATSIYRKLGSSTRSEAMAKAYEIGLLIR